MGADSVTGIRQHRSRPILIMPIVTCGGCKIDPDRPRYRSVATRAATPGTDRHQTTQCLKTQPPSHGNLRVEGTSATQWPHHSPSPFPSHGWAVSRFLDHVGHRPRVSHTMAEEFGRPVLRPFSVAFVFQFHDTAAMRHRPRMDVRGEFETVRMWR